MLPSIPGKGISKSAMKVAEKVMPAKKTSEKMNIIKKALPKNLPKKEFKQSMPLPKEKKVPANQPEFMKPGYKPGSIMRGYTKYA